MEWAPEHRPERIGRVVARRLVTVAALVGMFVALVAVRRQAPWIPWAYLLALVGLGIVVARLARLRTPRRGLRLGALAVAATLLLSLVPVPWMTARLDLPPGTAWRLDGRLHVDGERVDPPGDWYWLTVGRPPIVAEVVRGWFDPDRRPASMRGGTAASRPQMNEPAAVAVGMRAAGRDVELRLVIELSEPIVPRITERMVPERMVMATLNGRTLDTPAQWRAAVADLGERNTITGIGGTTYEFSGDVLPYARVDLLEVPAGELDAAIGGRLARSPVGRWFRGLALGRSHGLMVALVTYAHVSGDDLARGRTIAGTGGIRADGTVVRIGGLRSKALAASRLGADVLLVPAEQVDELGDLDLGDTEVIPVADLTDAIERLRACAPVGDCGP